MGNGSRQFVALIAALCFQAQALAAVLLPCAHESAPPALSAVHVCHDGGADVTGSADNGKTSDCEKCTLVMVLSVYDVPTFKLVPNQPVPLPLLVVAREDHFYRHAPDTPHRPPISHL